MYDENNGKPRITGPKIGILSIMLMCVSRSFQRAHAQRWLEQHWHMANRHVRRLMLAHGNSYRRAMFPASIRTGTKLCRAGNPLKTLRQPSDAFQSRAPDYPRLPVESLSYCFRHQTR